MPTEREVQRVVAFIKRRAIDDSEAVQYIAILRAALASAEQRARTQMVAACEAIRDECYRSWQSFAEDEQKKTGKAAKLAERHASEAYYAYETAADCVKAIRALGAAPTDEVAP